MDDVWGVGMEREERMDGDGGERGLGRGARPRAGRIARGRKRRHRERRRWHRLIGRVKNVGVVENNMFSRARHLAKCGCDATTRKGSLYESLEVEKESSRVRYVRVDDPRWEDRLVIADGTCYISRLFKLLEARPPIIGARIATAPEARYVER